MVVSSLTTRTLKLGTKKVFRTTIFPGLKTIILSSGEMVRRVGRILSNMEILPDDLAMNVVDLARKTNNLAKSVLDRVKFVDDKPWSERILAEETKFVRPDSAPAWGYRNV
jgi:hypothetical protein